MTLGYGDISCYGQKKYQTPQIDKLADEGVLVYQFLCANTVLRTVEGNFAYRQVSAASWLNPESRARRRHK
jgi:hypothetical protein